MIFIKFDKVLMSFVYFNCCFTSINPNSFINPLYLLKCF